MKKITVLLCGIWLVFSLTACGSTVETRSLAIQSTAPPVVQATKEPSTEQPGPYRTEQGQAEEKNDQAYMQMTIGEHIFTVRMYDNETAQAFAERLPLTLEMDELNGNEKFNYLSDSLPTEAEQPGRIQAGDLMLYGSDCLVLFYESFSTSYSYTRLGYMEDTSGLSEALGDGNVQVTFSIGEWGENGR